MRVPFEMPTLTGGSNGLVGMPALTFFGMDLSSNRSVLLVTIGLALVGAVVTAAVTCLLREHFAAIEENELLTALMSNDLEGTADALIATCLERGAPDNVTFVILRPR